MQPLLRQPAAAACCSAHACMGMCVVRASLPQPLCIDFHRPFHGCWAPIFHPPRPPSWTLGERGRPDSACTASHRAFASTPPSRFGCRPPCASAEFSPSTLPIDTYAEPSNSVAAGAHPTLHRIQLSSWKRSIRSYYHCLLPAILVAPSHRSIDLSSPPPLEHSLRPTHLV